jgi:hypothetical protein
VVRRLFTRDELLGRGYRADCLASERATLIPRGDRGNKLGRGGKIWMYTAYLTLWDEDEERLVPCIAYSVGGQDTSRVDRDTGERTAAVINLEDEYGITTPMWGYYHGLHTADPDPTWRASRSWTPTPTWCWRSSGCWRRASTTPSARRSGVLGRALARTSRPRPTPRRSRTSSG